jgi:hypothetical protein
MPASELFAPALMVVSLALIAVAAYQSRGKAEIKGLESMPMVIAAIGAMALLELHHAPAARPGIHSAAHPLRGAAIVREWEPAGQRETVRREGSLEHVPAQIMAHHAAPVLSAMCQHGERDGQGIINEPRGTRDGSERRHWAGPTFWCGDRAADAGADSDDTAGHISQPDP